MQKLLKINWGILKNKSNKHKFDIKSSVFGISG